MSVLKGKLTRVVHFSIDWNDIHDACCCCWWWCVWRKDRDLHPDDMEEVKQRCACWLYVCSRLTPSTLKLIFLLFRVEHIKGLDPENKGLFYLRGHMGVGAQVAEFVPRPRWQISTQKRWKGNSLHPHCTSTYRPQHGFGCESTYCCTTWLPNQKFLHSLLHLAHTWDSAQFSHLSQMSMPCHAVYVCVC